MFSEIKPPLTKRSSSIVISIASIGSENKRAKTINVLCKIVCMISEQ